MSDYDYNPERLSAIERNPVVLANLIAAAISAIIVAVVALGFLDWDAETQAAVMGAVVALVNVIVALWVTPQTTPVVDPRDDTGTPLVRASDGQPPVVKD